MMIIVFHESIDRFLMESLGPITNLLEKPRSTVHGLRKLGADIQNLARVCITGDAPRWIDTDQGHAWRRYVKVDQPKRLDE